MYSLHIDTPDSAIIIGPHGKNMSSIAHILWLILSKQLGHRAKLQFDVNDYAQLQQKKFFAFIESKIQYVESSWNDLKLPYMEAYDRKKIHAYISEKYSGNIFTKSIGEWSERRLFICKKSDMQSSIDIDGTNI